MRFAFALLATFVPAVASAQAPAAPAPCELHVWPAERFQAMTSGILGGGLLDAAIHAEGDKARRSHLASALDSEGQLATLQSMDLVSILQLTPGTVVVPHAEPLDRKTINNIKTRRAASQSSCYSELIVGDFFYQKSMVYGRSLRTFFFLRDFGSKQSDPAMYKSWGGNGLKIFPAKEGEDTTAADAELIDTFKFNFNEASRNIVRMRKTKA